MQIASQKEFQSFVICYTEKPISNKSTQYLVNKIKKLIVYQISYEKLWSLSHSFDNPSILIIFN